MIGATTSAAIRRAGSATRLADFAVPLRLESVPPDVRGLASLHLLDALGCGLAALGTQAGTAPSRVVGRRGGREEASILGVARRHPAADAALANGTLCHALDFDDTHAGAVAHPSAVVCPAALAAGESVGASGARVLAAIVAGNETIARIGLAASGAFHARGFHPTSVCGVFGAAAAAASLLGLDREQTAGALGLAGSMASGVFAYLDDGTPTKPLHAGFAAQAGVLAAELVREGAQGPRGIFEARFGFYGAFVGEGAEALAAELEDLGERWETRRIAFKAFPACHYMHGTLGAAATLLAEVEQPLRQVERIEVSVPPGPAASLVLEPEAAKRRPRTPYEAKFSLQYSLAHLLVHGCVDLAAYEPESLRDPDVLVLAARVVHRIERFPDADGSFPGAVRLVLHDGRALEARLAFEPGSPENPLSVEQVEAKFRANAGLALDSDAAAALLETIRHFDEQDDVAAALAPLRSARAAGAGHDPGP